MRRLLLAWRTNTHEASQKGEQLPLQRFCERVGDVGMHIDVADGQRLSSNNLTQEMPFDINVFDTSVESGIGGEADGAGVIDAHGSGRLLREVQSMRKSTQPDSLLSRLSSCIVFSLSG